jgi:hypothetical protein
MMAGAIAARSRLTVATAIGASCLLLFCALFMCQGMPKAIVGGHAIGHECCHPGGAAADPADSAPSSALPCLASSLEVKENAAVPVPDAHFLLASALPGPHDGGGSHPKPKPAPGRQQLIVQRVTVLRL